MKRGDSFNYGVNGPVTGLLRSFSSTGAVPSWGRIRKWVTAKETDCPTVKWQR